MADVTFEHVTKRFETVTAVSDFDLKIEDKEFLVLVGPSGCGKSTALRLLAGLETITEGNIYIGERLVNDVAAKDRDIAMVFQSYALYPHMTVHDNMAFGLSLRRIPKDQIRERVNDAAQILGIQELLDRKPRQLSGGQRQRVALGRAIVRDPKVFLLDEPLSNLDAKLRVQTRAEISKLHQRLGTTFIYVTHDQVEAMTMATRIAVMDRGLLQQVGTPLELYNSPRNIFVAGFIGSPATNFFDAVITGNAEELLADIGPAKLKVPQGKIKGLLPYMNKTVRLGLRPEDLHDDAFRPPDIIAAAVPTRVDVTELMGNEIFLHLTFPEGGDTFLARVDPRTQAKPGKEMLIAFNMAQMHAFDKETGLAIGENSARG